MKISGETLDALRPGLDGERFIPKYANGKSLPRKFTYKLMREGILSSIQTNNGEMHFRLNEKGRALFETAYTRWCLWNVNENAMHGRELYAERRFASSALSHAQYMHANTPTAKALRVARVKVTLEEVES